MSRRKILFPFSFLVLAALACSLPFSTVSVEEPTPVPPTAEVVTIVVTATPQPGPTPEEEAAGDGGMMATANQNLNIRSGPGTAYPITGTFYEGELVPVIGKNDDGSWILLSLNDGGSGWVSTPFTTVGDLSGVPVVDVPPPPAAAAGEESDPTSPAPTADGGGGGQTAPADEHFSTELNIKNDVQTFQGVISYPEGDSLDQVFIKIDGFDGVVTSGEVSFTLTCSGEGVGNAKVFGGGTCNDTWTEFVTNDSDQETIRVYLDSGGYAYVSWTLIVSANN